MSASLLFIISGASGSGKTTLCNSMIAKYAPNLRRVITATTRLPREGEQDGKDYYFFPKEAFLKKVEAGEFYEHATVYSNLYGTLKSEIHSKLSQGLDLILSIDVQGAATFRKEAQLDSFLKNRCASIFIFLPDVNELRNRLSHRALDAEEIIKSRLSIANEENKEWVNFDYCISSKSKEEDFSSMESIYLSEKLRVRSL